MSGEESEIENENGKNTETVKSPDLSQFRPTNAYCHRIANIQTFLKRREYGTYLLDAEWAAFQAVPEHKGTDIIIVEWTFEPGTVIVYSFDEETAMDGRLYKIRADAGAITALWRLDTDTNEMEEISHARICVYPFTDDAHTMLLEVGEVVDIEEFSGNHQRTDSEGIYVVHNAHEIKRVVDFITKQD